VPEEPILLEPVRTSRLLLRSLEEGDRAAYIRMMDVSREHLAPWSPAEDPHETPDHRFDRALATCRKGLQAGSACRLAGLLDDGRIAGLFNLNNIVRGVFQSADAGWLVASDCTGRGIATEGVIALLDVAFAPPPIGLGLHRVQAAVIPANLASLRVAARCGFKREGFSPEYLRIAGRWQDHILMAVRARSLARPPK
jgi:ribosomal-protein-alanine N-acetyltransferase